MLPGPRLSWPLNSMVGYTLVAGTPEELGSQKTGKKMNSAQLLGWTVLEVTPEHVKSGQLRAWLLAAFNQDQDQKRTNP